MEREEDINEEMKNIAPGFPVKKSMDAPPGYFETLPDRILNRWRKEGSQPILKRILWWKVASIAAVLTGLSIGGWWFLISSSTNEMTDITSIEAYQYVNENIGEFESLIETEDIIIDENLIDVPKEGIDEYLMEELDGSDPEELF